MNKSQIKGIAIIIFGVIAYILLDNNLIQTISEFLCAIGLGFCLNGFLSKNKTRMNN